MASCRDKQKVLRGRCRECECGAYISEKGLKCEKCHHPPVKHENLDILLSANTGQSSEKNYGAMTQQLQYCTPQQVQPTLNQQVHQPPPMFTHQVTQHGTSDSGSYPVTHGTNQHIQQYGYDNQQHGGSQQYRYDNQYHGHADQQYGGNQQYVYHQQYGHDQQHGGTSQQYGSTQQYGGNQHYVKCEVDGCSNSVFQHSSFGNFKYCSPSCRDQHFLPEYNKKLEEDVKKYSQPHPATSSSGATPSSSTKKSSSSTKKSSPSPATADSVQNTVKLELEPKQDLELILSDESTDKGIRIVVVGARSHCVDWLCDQKVLLLDAIVSVKPALEHAKAERFRNSKELKEFCNPKTKLEFELDHKNGLNLNVASFFEEVKKREVKTVLCLKSHNKTNYGFIIDNNQKVYQVERASDAKRFGLTAGVKISLYTTASANKLHEVITEIPNYEKFNEDMKEASQKGHYLVIGVY